MKLVIHKELCPQNHKCPAVAVCPVDALTQKGLLAPEVDAETCVSCGKCAEACPTGALQMVK